jgi:hypothetical protein
VQDGDTLFSIAEAQLPSGDSVAAFAQAIATLGCIDIGGRSSRPRRAPAAKPPQ